MFLINFKIKNLNTLNKINAVIERKKYWKEQKKKVKNKNSCEIVFLIFHIFEGLC